MPLGNTCVCGFSLMTRPVCPINSPAQIRTALPDLSVAYAGAVPAFGASRAESRTTAPGRPAPTPQPFAELRQSAKHLPPYPGYWLAVPTGPGRSRAGLRLNARPAIALAHAHDRQAGHAEGGGGEQ